jgi:hypothetical protein
MTKMRSLIILLFILGISKEANAMEWFQTWDRPEYQEWAAVIPEGYLLHIVRKEKTDWLVVQAKLMMGEGGLPGFEVLEQKKCSNEETAYGQIKTWGNDFILNVTQ